LFKILEPGLKTTIQDMGRYGYYHLGVPPSGAADKYSFQLGNLLLGNQVDAAALEITLLGPKIEIQKHTVINITGAPTNVKRNGVAIPMWENIEVQEGDTLTFEYLKESASVYTYICVSGGILSPHILDSQSTFELSDFEGLLSKKLGAGVKVAIKEPLPGVFKSVGRKLEPSFIPSFSKDINLRAVMGLTSDRIDDSGIRGFLNNEWTVQIESNRVACRLKGAVIHYKDYEPPFGSGSSFANVVDIAYPIGSIIVPNSEEIIVLLNDATGGGGFVSLGTVISTDLDKLSQAAPFSTLRFHAVTVNQAIQYRLEYQKRITKIIESFK
jgi:biotin-dependent carboxylase-like uncharacterized protein